LTAIVSVSDKSSDEIWTLLECLAAHLVAAAKDVANRKEEALIESPTERNLVASNRHRSLEEIQKLVYLKKLAAI
jgi:hypothetical protein